MDWSFDHSTTTAEAAAHSGGQSGMGGDLLYRWGNPQTYGAGSATDQQLFVQHDAEWIADGLPGAGNILIFNNGQGRPGGNYSTIDEIATPVEADGSTELVDPSFRCYPTYYSRPLEPTLHSTPTSDHGHSCLTVGQTSATRTAIVCAVMTSNDVRALVRACGKGDPEAWDAFLNRYGRLIWSVALRSGANNAEAQEIFQRTWVAVVEGIGRLKDPRRVQGWLASTTRHQTWQLYDEQRRARRFDSIEAAHEQGAEPTIDALQESDLLAIEAGEAAHKALAEIDDRCRELLTHLFLADPPLDYQEISRRTGLAIGSIGPIRARCLNRLRMVFSKLYQPHTENDT